MTNSPFGKPAADIQAAYRELMDAQPLITRCALCPRWQHIGTADQGRDAAAAHRAERHPDVVPVRRRRGHLNRWCVSQDSFREEGNVNAAEVAAMHAAREARQSAA